MVYGLLEQHSEYVNKASNPLLDYQIKVIRTKLANMIKNPKLKSLNKLNVEGWKLFMAKILGTGDALNIVQEGSKYFFTSSSILSISHIDIRPLNLGLVRGGGLVPQ